METFNGACGIFEYHSQPKNAGITTLPADRIGNGGGGRRGRSAVEKKGVSKERKKASYSPRQLSRMRQAHRKGTVNGFINGASAT